MTRVVALAALVLPLAVVAAPVPKDDEAAKLKKEWGEFVNPGGDCTIKLAGTRLTIRTPSPGRWRGRWTERRTADRHYFPSVVRRVTGDFEVRVTVARLTDPDRAASVQRESFGRVVEAGLLVADAAGSAVGVYRDHAIADPTRTPDPIDRIVGVNLASPVHESTRVRQGTDVPPAGSVALRLGRKGGAVYTADSPDGKAWVEHGPRPNATDLADAVTVGVYLTHTTNQPCEAVFEDFALTQPAK